MKVSEHFDIREFVPRAIWDIYGAKSVWFVDGRLIEGMEYIRKLFNSPITINNWHNGGDFQNRGFRMPDTKVGAKLSQHKFGRAVDFNVQGLNSDEVFDRIWANRIGIVEHTSFIVMEDKRFTQGWTHLDMRETQDVEFFIVKP